MEQPKIKLYDKNAKIHTDEQLELLAKVVKEVGWRQNVEVNQDGVIVAGHGRYLSWVKYKDQYQLPDIWITDGTGKTIFGEHATFPMTEEQEKMWRLADNQISAMTGMDMKLVIPELKGLSMEMLDLTGYSRDLIIEPDEKDDQIPTDVPAITQPGDLYELGGYVVCKKCGQKHYV